MRRSFLPRPARLLTGLMVLGMTGCLGPVDRDAAFEVVYDQQGTPAFIGQAMAIQSCGAGAFCHRMEPALGPDDEREPLDLRDRFGAPQGLDFDVRIANVGASRNEAELDRLAAQQANIRGNATLVWSQVSAGHMPPGGDVGREYEAEIDRLGIRFDRFSDSGEPSPLPSLDMDEDDGREIFRNWLAAGAVVIDRTEPTDLGGPGEYAPSCNRECVEPTFESIYRVIVRPTCTSSRCHGSEDAAAGLNLRFGEIANVDDPAREAELAAVTGQAWMRLVEDGSLSEMEQCGRSGLPLLEANDAMRSIFYRKLLFASDDLSQCGSRMPLSGAPLNEQRLCAIRTWIDCGACAPDDDTCDVCVSAGYAACEVTTEGECVEQQRCSNRLP